MLVQPELLDDAQQGLFSGIPVWGKTYCPPGPMINHAGSAGSTEWPAEGMFSGIPVWGENVLFPRPDDKPCWFSRIH